MLGALRGCQVARICGVSPQVVTTWAKRGCPRNADRTYDLAAVCGWLRTGGLDLDTVPQDRTIQVLGITRPTIGAWEQRGCPRNAKGSYNLAEVVQWRLREQEEKLSLTREQLTGHRARREAALAERAEIELAEIRGDLLSRRAIVAGWIARYRTLAAMLENMLRRMRANGLPVEHSATAEGEVDAMLSELQRPQPALQLTEAEAAVLAVRAPREPAPLAPAAQPEAPA